MLYFENTMEQLERIKVKILKTALGKSKLEYAKDALTYIDKLEKQLAIQRVSSSLNEEMTIDDHLQNIGKHRKKAKILFAIKKIKDAECENDVLDAIALKEELDWFNVDEELKDQWNDYFGDAKKYLP